MRFKSELFITFVYRRMIFLLCFVHFAQLSAFRRHLLHSPRLHICNYVHKKYVFFQECFSFRLKTAPRYSSENQGAVNIYA